MSYKVGDIVDSEDTLPQGVGDSDPEAVADIIKMENAIEACYNNEFLHDPTAPLAYYADPPNVLFQDILSPGDYYGTNVRKWFEFIGPQYVGRLELRDHKVWVKGDTGFVVMKQHYYGTDPDGKSFHWIMRQTDGVVKQNGQWKIAHTHMSWCVDTPSMTANLMNVTRPLPWDK